jgi:hypothetical protein
MSAVQAPLSSTRPVAKSHSRGSSQAGQPAPSGGQPHAHSPPKDSDSVFHLEPAQSGASEQGAFSSSFDDPEAPAQQLGYKDELALRFIWDRVLGKGAPTPSLFSQHAVSQIVMHA